MAIRIRKKRFKKLLLVFDALLVLVLCVSLFFLVRTLIGYGKNERLYAEAQQLALVSPAPTPSVPPAAAPAATAPQQAEATPAPPSEVPVTIDFEALHAVNKEIVAWLYCADTPINYPVVRHNDNEYYLTRGYDKSKDAGGALFADCRCTDALAEQNVIIYGHRMKNDSMFGTLESFASKDYADAHKSFYLITPAQAYRIELYATRTVQSEIAYFPVYFGEGEYERYISKALGQAHFASGVSVSDAERSITLVTCSRYTRFEDPKFLLHGKLVPVY